jgi:hypothetical protein
MQDSINNTVRQAVGPVPPGYGEIVTDAIAALEKREQAIVDELAERAAREGLSATLVTEALRDAGLSAGPEQANGYDEAIRLMNQANRLIEQANTAMTKQREDDAARLSEQPF